MSLSEIRVNTTKTRTGVGTITYTETGPVITGIATASNFKTGSTNVHSTGVELTNINTGGSTATFGGAISGTTASFSGTVSIGGTLTYEDVTNIDSVGVVTAREGVVIPDDKEITFGAGGDGFIKSDGANFLIQGGGGGTGQTYVRGRTLRLSANGGSGGFNGAVTIDVSGDERVQLKYGSGTKLVTTSSGVTVTGALTATSFVGGLPITNGADNRVITASSASAIQGESNFTYDGNEVAIYAQTDDTDCILHLVGKTPSGGVGQAGRTAIIAESTSTSNGQSSMHLRTRNTSNAQLIAMTLDGNQKVGIGTQLPSSKLTVAADSAQAKIELKRTNSNGGSGSYGAINWTANDGHSVANIYAIGDGDDNGAHLLFKTTSAAASNDPYNAATVERLRIDSSGRILIADAATATNTPMETFGSAVLQVATTAGGSIVLGRNDTSVAVDNNIGGIYWDCNDSSGNAWNDVARIGCAADGTHGDGDYPSRLTFHTTADGEATVTERLRITSDGQLNLGSRTATSGGTTPPTHFRISRSDNANAALITMGAHETAQSSSAPGAVISSNHRDFIITKYHPDFTGNSPGLWLTGNEIRMYAGSLERIRIKSDGTLYTVNKIGCTTSTPFSRLQVGSHTFSGGHGMYHNDRVGMSNHGSLTGLMLASTYNDANHPEYGLVFVQGPSTSSYNVWSMSPDGPAKGNSLNLHYLAQSTNIHSPGNRKFQFTGEGYFLKSKTPSFFVNASPTIGTQSGNTYVAYSFSNIKHNIGSHYNNSNGRFTAPVAGTYMFGGGLWCNSSDNTAGSHLLVFDKNGSEAGVGCNHRHSGNQLTATMVIELAANDYIQLGFASGSGGSTQNSTPRNYFWGYLVG